MLQSRIPQGYTQECSQVKKEIEEDFRKEVCNVVGAFIKDFTTDSEQNVRAMLALAGKSDDALLPGFMDLIRGQQDPDGRRLVDGTSLLTWAEDELYTPVVTQHIATLQRMG